MASSFPKFTHSLNYFRRAGSNPASTTAVPVERQDHHQLHQTTGANNTSAPERRTSSPLRSQSITIPGQTTSSHDDHQPPQLKPHSTDAVTPDITGRRGPKSPSRFSCIFDPHYNASSSYGSPVSGRGTQVFI